MPRRSFSLISLAVFLLCVVIYALSYIDPHRPSTSALTQVIPSPRASNASVVRLRSPYGPEVEKDAAEEEGSPWERRRREKRRRRKGGGPGRGGVRTCLPEEVGHRPTEGNKNDTGDVPPHQHLEDQKEQQQGPRGGSGEEPDDKMKKGAGSSEDPKKNPEWGLFADRGYRVVGGDTVYRRLPDVVIIGVKKAGTRALLEFLRVHPSIRAAGTEMHFFDRLYHKGLSWYRSKMPESLEGQLTMEKTPAYFFTPEVPARVHRDLPGVKLLLVVRNPVDRALSDYTQSVSNHGVRRPFEDLVFVNASTGLVNADWGPISVGLYARHLQRWLKHFPRARLHVVSGENLVADPAQELAKVQDFLGLHRVITERHFFYNATKGFPCLVKKERSGRPHCLGSSKGRRKPQVSVQTLQALKDFYRPFNLKFFKMTGQTFDWN
ncbi:heparan sulfate glucosamine 3-O-sulfotransferase 6-like [Oratosquilla oratoria]|uniref:heparan sulfate glucosamine 3-O-sulfotransferase 6-like n=1 Tax=Oratosquilla oratoria TaxID=337810 RepID=UPI003F75FBC4